MKTSYMKRSLMLLGAAAMFASAGAEGTFVDVTHKYLKEPAYFPGWQGMIGAVGTNSNEEGIKDNPDYFVAECWNGPFRLYQVLENVPAGEYTLTVDAFYRCGNNDFSKANMPTNPELYKAYIFAGDAKQTVKGLFDGRDEAPNSMIEADAAFKLGDYVNKLTFTHNGGDLTVGICNTGCYWDEWCCFDNFKLVGPNGDVAIANGDFSQGIDAKKAWNCKNASDGEKTPDIMKDGSGSGTFRKCGGSPYKYGQQIELPAGTYRWSMLAFHRYGSEVDAKGNYYNHKWPCSNLMDDGSAQPAYGAANRTPKDWFEANDYDQKEYDHGYIFVSKQDVCPQTMKFSDPDDEFMTKPLIEGDLRVRVKDCWELNNGDLEAMPHNNPVRVEGNDTPADKQDWKDVLPYESVNKVIYRNDSGSEKEAGAAFLNEPEKYYHYIEFTLDEPTKVWVGMGKDSQTSDGYWHAWGYQKIEVLSGSSAVEGVEVEAEAPVEYYNLQGVRVAEPANGIYIVKQGKKASKQIFK